MRCLCVCVCLKNKTALADKHTGVHKKKEKEKKNQYSSTPSAATLTKLADGNKSLYARCCMHHIVRNVDPY